MAQFSYRTIEIRQDATVLVTAVLHESEIPKDAQGRLVAQVQQGGSGGSPESVKVMLHHGGHRGNDGPAKLELKKLFDQGFCINNICAIADATRAGFYTVRVWLTHDVSGKGMSIGDWGEAGEFVADLFSYGWSGPKVVDHNDGKMVSFGMYGRTIPGHYNRTILQPKVIPAKVAGTAVATSTDGAVPTQPDISPVATQGPAKQNPANQAKPAKVPALLAGIPQTAVGFALAEALHKQDSGNLSPADINAVEVAMDEEFMSKRKNAKDMATIVAESREALDSQGRTWSEVLRDEDAVRSELYPQE